MSLFSKTNPEILTTTPITTARVGSSDSDTALLRLLSLSVVLGLLIMMAVVAIFVVRLHPVPAFPGTRTGENQDKPKMVKALDTLRFSRLPSPTLSIGKGGDLNDSHC